MKKLLALALLPKSRAPFVSSAVEAMIGIAGWRGVSTMLDTNGSFL
jgi:hypothetical protein